MYYVICILFKDILEKYNNPSSHKAMFLYNPNCRQNTKGRCYKDTEFKGEEKDLGGRAKERNKENG